MNNKKPAWSRIFVFGLYLGGVNFNAGAWNALAGKMILLGLNEDDLAINRCMNREVTAHERARASDLRSASLANKYFASANRLTTKTLDAEALTSVVV